MLTVTFSADVSCSHQEEGAIEGPDPAQVLSPPMHMGWLAAQRAPHCCCSAKVVEVDLWSPYYQLAVQAIELLRLEVVDALFRGSKAAAAVVGLGSL